MKRITSRQNPVVSRYRTVARGEEPATILLDGARLIAEALSAGIPIRHAVVASEAIDRPDVQTVLAALDRQHVDTVSAPAPVMALVSPVRAPSSVVALIDRPSDRERDIYSPAAPLVVIACGVQDPGNLGAIVRVAEAAGATGVVAAGACADPFSWKALRGSMGSALRLPIAVRPRVLDAIDRARQAHCRVVATTPRGGIAPDAMPLTGAVALLLGGEGTGLSPDIVTSADERLTIGMQPPVESLNAAVTAAVLLYEARRQRAETAMPAVHHARS